MGFFVVHSFLHKIIAEMEVWEKYIDTHFQDGQVSEWRSMNSHLRPVPSAWTCHGATWHRDWLNAWQEKGRVLYVVLKIIH